jgi:hypothetical protein
VWGLEGLRASSPHAPMPPRPVGWRSALCAILWLWCSLPATLRADDFVGNGPLPVRNFQPVQLIFLNLPFERARVLRPGELAIYLESAEINEVATNQEDISAVLKFETNRTVLGGSIGLGHAWEIGLGVPFISRFGGFLDPFIDGVEDLFQASNPERHQFPDNTYAGFRIQRGDVLLFHGPNQEFELGDMWAEAKYEVWHASGLPTVSLRGAIKAPTGRAGGVFGSGKPDFGVGAAAEHRFLNWLVAYGNLNLIYPLGPITPGRLTLNPILTEGVGAEARVWRQLSFVLQQETYTSPFHTGTRLLDGTVVELALGFNFAWDRFLLQLGAIDNVSPVVAAADFTLLGRVTYRRGS